MKKLILGLLLGLLAGSPVFGASTINTAVPAPNAPLQSQPIRQNFINAASDYNAQLGMFATNNCPGISGPIVGQDCLNVAASPAIWYKWTGSLWTPVGTINLSNGSVVMAPWSGDATSINPGTHRVVMSASTTARAGLNVGVGTAPTSAVDGDVWSTTSGLYVQVNGGTVGPLLGVGTSSANINYIPPGVGATTRTVQDRLRDAVDVKDYGAACDGSDAGPPIQDAVTYAVSVQRPVDITSCATHYTIATTISLPSLAYITGTGLLVAGANIAVLNVQDGAQKVTIENISIDGKKSSFATSSGITFTGAADDVLIRNVEVYNAGGSGIQPLSTTTHYTIENSRIHDNDGRGIALGGQYCIIRGNFASGNGLAGYHSLGLMQDCVIIGNVGQGNGIISGDNFTAYDPGNLHVLYIGNLSSGSITGHGFHVSGNFIGLIGNISRGDHAQGIYVSSANADGSGTAVAYVVVSANIVESAVLGSAIRVELANSATITGNTTHLSAGQGIIVKNASNCTISGNTSDTDLSGVFVVQATGTDATNNCTITGNTVVGATDATRAGIYVQGTSGTNVLNALVASNQVTQGAGDGIRLDFVTGYLVATNYVKSNAGNGVYINQTGNGSTSGNVLIGNTGNAIQIAGSGAGNSVTTNYLLSNGGTIVFASWANISQIFGNDGYLGGNVVANVAAPGTPGTGMTAYYTNSTYKRLNDIDDAGVIGTTVVPATAGTHQFATAVNANGSLSFAQPACAYLSDASVFCSSTDAAGLTGTVASARLSGSYTGITGVGTITVGVWNGTAIANANLANSSVTISGHLLSLGGSLNLVASDVGLGSVTNDAQTKAAIVPNTAPTAGQLLFGNAGGTAYAPQSASQDCTVSSAGAFTCLKTNNVSFGTAATKNTGTSGATIPLLNAANAFSAQQTFTNTTDSQAIFSGWSATGGAQTYNSTIYLGATSAFRGVLNYDGSGSTTFYIDNTEDAAGALMAFRLRTAGTPVTALQLTGAGNATIVGTLAVVGLPTSAGAGGLNVCVDTSGNFYKKAACP